MPWFLGANEHINLTAKHCSASRKPNQSEIRKAITEVLICGYHGSGISDQGDEVRLNVIFRFILHGYRFGRISDKSNCRATDEASAFWKQKDDNSCRTEKTRESDSNRSLLF